jgi:hypothetical protein
MNRELVRSEEILGPMLENSCVRTSQILLKLRRVSTWYRAMVDPVIERELWFYAGFAKVLKHLSPQKICVEYPMDEKIPEGVTHVWIRLHGSVKTPIPESVTYLRVGWTASPKDRTLQNGLPKSLITLSVKEKYPLMSLRNSTWDLSHLGRLKVFESSTTLEVRNLPEGLETLKMRAAKLENMENLRSVKTLKIRIPESLHFLETAGIPPNVTHLRVELESYFTARPFCSSIFRKLPNTITELVIGSMFDDPVDEFPPTLRRLTLKGIFNRPLDKLPAGLRDLVVIGRNFRQSLDNLPANLESLFFAGRMEGVTVDRLPGSLTRLRIGGIFDSPLDSLPKNLQHFELSRQFEIKHLDHDDRYDVRDDDDDDDAPTTFLGDISRPCRYHHPLNALPPTLKTVLLHRHVAVVARDQESRKTPGPLLPQPGLDLLVVRGAPHMRQTNAFDTKKLVVQDMSKFDPFMPLPPSLTHLCIEQIGSGELYPLSSQHLTHLYCSGLYRAPISLPYLLNLTHLNLECEKFFLNDIGKGCCSRLRELVVVIKAINYRRPNMSPDLLSRLDGFRGRVSFGSLPPSLERLALIGEIRPWQIITTKEEREGGGGEEGGEGGGRGRGGEAAAAAAARNAKSESRPVVNLTKLAIHESFRASLRDLPPSTTEVVICCEKGCQVVELVSVMSSLDPMKRQKVQFTLCYKPSDSYKDPFATPMEQYYSQPDSIDALTKRTMRQEGHVKTLMTTPVRLFEPRPVTTFEPRPRKTFKLKRRPKKYFKRKQEDSFEEIPPKRAASVRLADFIILESDDDDDKEKNEEQEQYKEREDEDEEDEDEDEEDEDEEEAYEEQQEEEEGQYEEQQEEEGQYEEQVDEEYEEDSGDGEGEEKQDGAREKRGNGEIGKEEMAQDQQSVPVLGMSRDIWLIPSDIFWVKKFKETYDSSSTFYSKIFGRDILEGMDKFNFF